MVKILADCIKGQVLHLSSWPSLQKLSQEAVPDVTRICALLARRPSVGMLIPVLLHMPAPAAYELLETLYVSGHIYTDKTPETAEPASFSAESGGNHEPDAISFISRLWKRLTSHDA
jgi:hypothetical protein